MYCIGLNIHSVYVATGTVTLSRALISITIGPYFMVIENHMDSLIHLKRQRVHVRVVTF